jgi:hypothetical protein
MKKPPKFTDSQLKVAVKMLPRINKKTGKHAKKCECYVCITAKLEAFKEKVTAMRGVTPESADRVVPVRAYWRKQANYLSKSPILREAIERIVRELLKK